MKPQIFQGIVPVKRSQILPDMLAGITLATLSIPEVMGYTKIAGTPVITGLYSFEVGKREKERAAKLSVSYSRVS